MPLCGYILGKMKSKPNLMLLATYSGQPVAGWLMQEKMDGMRVYWDGSSLWTRDGNSVDKALSAGLPEGVALDGELWAGRGGFSRTVSAHRSRLKDWTGVSTVWFDAPAHSGTYADRLDFVRSMHLQTPETTVCTSAEHAFATMRRIVAEGGEGIVLRNPAALWKAGRSRNALKMKPGEGA